MKVITTVTVVKLKRDGYSVPKGTMGYVDQLHESGEPNCRIVWARDPGPGGWSMPVLVEDLEVIGRLDVERHDIKHPPGFDW